MRAKWQKRYTVAFKSTGKEARCPSPWLCLASKSNQKWKLIQMCLNFSLSCTVAHVHKQAAHTDCLLADMIGNTGCALSVGLMSSGQNHFRQSQQRINNIIMINGNQIIFTPDIIICSFSFSPSCFCLHNPHTRSLSFLSLLLSALLPLWPHFLFSKPVHHFFSFFSTQFKSNTSFKSESFSENFRGRDAPAASPLCSRYCLSAATPQGCFIQKQPETESPNRLSTEGSECASGGNSVQSSVR